MSDSSPPTKRKEKPATNSGGVSGTLTRGSYP